MLNREVAIYINVGARRVSDEVIEHIKELIPPEDIFIASNAEEDEIAALKIIERGYKSLFLGGGDGTFVRFVNRMIRLLGDPYKLPNIGILKLGTGNAVARLVSSENTLSDLRSYLTNPSRDFMKLSLIETDGLYYPFAGLGWDAQWLDDYERLNTLFPEVIKGRIGYVSAFLLGTVPKRALRMITGKKVFVEITNHEKSAYWVDQKGEKGKEIPPNSIIYKGEINSIALGTVPDYGYGIKILPFASKYPEFMHMRIVTISMIRALISAPSVYKGTFRHPGVLDVYCSDCTARLSEPMPFQIAGESMGSKAHVTFHTVPSVVNLIRFI